MVVVVRSGEHNSVVEMPRTCEALEATSYTDNQTRQTKNNDSSNPWSKVDASMDYNSKFGAGSVYAMRPSLFRWMMNKWINSFIKIPVRWWSSTFKDKALPGSTLCIIKCRRSLTTEESEMKLTKVLFYVYVCFACKCMPSAWGSDKYVRSLEMQLGTDCSESPRECWEQNLPKNNKCS